MPSFLSVLPSRFVVTQLFASISVRLCLLCSSLSLASAYSGVVLVHLTFLIALVVPHTLLFVLSGVTFVRTVCICSHASAEPAMQVDQIMQWFATKQKGRSRYSMMYWPWPGVVPSVVQGTHLAQSLSTVVSHNVTVVTLDFFGVISSR